MMVQHQSTLVFTQITEVLCMSPADQNRIKMPSQPAASIKGEPVSHKRASRVPVPNQSVHKRRKYTVHIVPCWNKGMAW